MANWLEVSEKADSKVGIVMATDIARHDLGSPGEYTQGAGSVSLLVKKNPRIMTIDPHIGVFTKDENDFFRPIGSRTAVVDGKYSNFCYLSAMYGAFESYRKRVVGNGMIRVGDEECLTDHLSHLMDEIGLAPEEKVRDSTLISGDVGNIYTGSMRGKRLI